MKKTCLIILLAIIFFLMPYISNASFDDNYYIKNSSTSTSTTMLVRLYGNYSKINIPRDIEIISLQPNQWIDILLDSSSLFNVIQKVPSYSILIPDLDDHLNHVRGSYHTLAETESILQNIAIDYPTITSLYSIGTTYENRDIWCLEISDNPGGYEGEPGVVLMGLHHAREWPSLEICLHIANQLTSEYGVDPTITDIVDDLSIFLIACVNPDGYYFDHDLGNDWRKNRRYLPEFDTYGIDLNRNYGGSSDGDIKGIWGSVGEASVSHHSNQEVYCGPAPFSENETLAIKNLFLNHEIYATISWHTYGQLVLWPWGYDDTLTPDSTYLAQIGTQMAQAITRQSGSGSYTPQQSAYLYPTTGDTTDWVYGYHHYIVGRPCFAYTIEACDHFHPPSVVLDQVIAENFDGAMVLLQEVENIRDTIIPRVIPPEIDEMGEDSDGNYTISWTEQNPNAAPTKFQLDELSDFNSVVDDAEIPSSYWIIDEFSRSSERSHSGSYSYKSLKQNQKISAITTVNPMPIKSDTTLSFWCWYDIETNWDYAFIEISSNGRTYDIIDKFTGNSGGWIEKQYDLSSYEGTSLYIRFRYSTDLNTVNEGFYVDDIFPIAIFGNITTLSDIITNASYEILGQPEGVYNYRVRGYNSEYEWGDFSSLEDIKVMSEYNQAPNIPTIEGVTRGKAGVTYTYTFTAEDPDNDSIWYYIDWDDETTQGWIGPFNSSESIVLPHSWGKKGDYIIQCKAKDSCDAESEWCTLEIQMPHRQIFIRSLFAWLLQKFPLLHELLYYSHTLVIHELINK